MTLTNNFRLKEFTHSKTAVANGLKNEPNDRVVENIKTLCTRLLQPLRDSYNEAFRINSGYRCLKLNRLVGGVPSSQHTVGQAVDVKVNEPRKLLTELLKSGLMFDQAILYPTFLHLSYNSANNRKQVLYAKGVKP